MSTGTIIGIIGSLIGIAGAVFGIFRNFASDKSADGREMGKILADLGYIKSTLDNISDKVNTQDKRHSDIITKLAVLDTFKDSILNSLHDYNDRFNALTQEIDKLKVRMTELENK